MTKIMYARSREFLGPEFNDFLFASIATDQNGGCLSVVSALARLDLDPWDEAAKLTKLPAEIATQNLSALITTLQGLPTPRQEPRAIAAHLVTLLPRRMTANIPPLNVPSNTTWMRYSHFTISIILMSIAIMMGVQVLTHSSPPSQPNGATHGAISNTHPEMPPPSVN